MDLHQRATGGPAALGTHWPALDGLRGVAILLVVLHHCAVEAPPHTLSDWVGRFMYDGWVGVDLFFVLSGFLITGILYDARGSDHALRNFYVRRVLRIFPLYYGTLLVVFGLTAALGDRASGEFRAAWAHQRWFWLYGTNILYTLKGGFIGEPLSHFWSLAVEEHFYLLWPFVVLFFPRRGAMGVCLGAMMAALGLRWWFNGSDYALGAYVLTPCRMDALAAGALLALLCREKGGIVGLVKPARWTALMAAIPLAAIIILKRGHVKPAGEGYEMVVTAGMSLLAVFFAATLLLAIRPGDHLLGRTLSAPWLRFLGKYSYGLYIFHFIFHPFIFEWAGPTHVQTWTGSLLLGIIVYVGITLAISVSLALLSWHLYEKQFLKLKQYFEYRPRPQTARLIAMPAP
jgi:peptidoglycan/LPS O-acetylase OafA/YrhL